MKKAIIFSVCTITLMILFPQVVRAQGAKAAATNTLGKPTASKNGQVLDFEGEVIEGERKRPDLFLSISTKDLNFDSLLYLRNNFNDYLEIDRKSRNRYFKVKGK